MSPLARCDVALGLLAGGRATRLDGADKAWLVRDGIPQITRLLRRLQGEVGEVLISANRNLARYAQHGSTTIADTHADAGPLGGLHALAHATQAPWLFTVPVDVIDVNDCLLRTLAQAGHSGAYAIDDEGAQPLVALWPTARLREAADAAIAAHDFAVHRLQQRLGLQGVRFAGLRFGNLNTPADLAAAGIEMDPSS